MHNMVANEWSVYDASLEIMRALVAALSGETRNLQGTACNLQRAACNLPCNLQGTTCNLQRATCGVQHAACNMHVQGVAPFGSEAPFAVKLPLIYTRDDNSMDYTVTFDLIDRCGAGRRNV
jgi:hypothetical protein